MLRVAELLEAVPGAPDPRNLKIRFEFEQGAQHECSPVHLRVRQCDGSGIRYLIVKGQKIDIDQPWTPILAPHPTELQFNGQQVPEQLGGACLAMHFNNRIDEIILGAFAPRRTAIES